MDKKEFLRNPPCCKEEINPSNLAGLYTMLEKHGLENNVYIHPFFAFRRGVNDPRGFSIGSGADDDLPERFRIPVGKMATLVHKLLRDQNVFSKPSSRSRMPLPLPVMVTLPLRPSSWMLIRPLLLNQLLWLQVTLVKWLKNL